MTRHYQDTETRRRQVGEAALLTIAEDGVSGFTTRAVAARVGISDGTLFRHFRNKEEIVLEAVRLLGAEIDAGLGLTGDPLQDLHGFFHHRARFVGAEGSVGRLIFSDGLVHLAGQAGRQKIAGWRKRSVDYLIERLSQLEAAGRLNPALDAASASMVLQGILLTFAMQASLGRGGSASELQARIDHAWETLGLLLFN